MRLFRKKDDTPQKEIVITGVDLISLDPSKKYLIVFDTHALLVDDAIVLSQQMKLAGIHGLLVGVDGGPGESVQIIER